VAFTSCSGYSAPDPAAGWADMAIRTNIDLVLLLGDNHYANSVDTDKQRHAYGHQRQSVGFRARTEGTPTYGIWDDHDFGPDNSDGTLPDKERALRAFREHWANPGYGQPEDPGVYHRFTRGAVDVFMLDVRYHRSPNKAADDGTKTMLGEAQLAWLKRELKASRARVNILASGSEWQSHGTEDSWSRFKLERDDLFEFLKAEGIGGVFLISGDRHFTAAYQVAGRFIEVTSGPLGGNTAKPGNTPELFLKHGDGRFYSVLDVDTVPEQPVLTLEIYRIGTGLVERRVFGWDEIEGRKVLKP
jgi:alkaline phosphatase D